MAVISLLVPLWQHADEVHAWLKGGGIAFNAK